MFLAKITKDYYSSMEKWRESPLRGGGLRNLLKLHNIKIYISFTL